MDEALALIEKAPPDLLLLDIRLSPDARDRGGLDLLRKLRATGSSVPAVMVTSLVELAEIREAMRNGAQDYVLKDELCPEMLLPIVESVPRAPGAARRGRAPARAGRPVVGARGHRRLVARDGERPPPDPPRRRRERDGAHPRRDGHRQGARRAGAARDERARRNEPFVAVNCSALPGTLIESLIFGHERGAFTGAERRTRGQLELAGGGTMLLDEIAEMPIELQAKLLRVLEDRRFRPLGAEEERPLLARIVASTHVDLQRRIAEGRFREDLFYRLNVVTLHVPSLAERVEDIPELVASFSARAAAQAALHGARDGLARAPALARATCASCAT